MTYTQINNEILNQKALNGGLDIFELGVYIYALKWQNKPNFLFSTKQIQEQYGAGRVVITRAIKSLEAKGLLEREFYYDEKGYRRAFYRVTTKLKHIKNDFIDEDDGVLLVSEDAPAPQGKVNAPAEAKQEMPQTQPQQKPLQDNQVTRAGITIPSKV